MSQGLERFQVSADWLNTGCAELSIWCTGGGCRWGHEWAGARAPLTDVLTIAATHPPADCPQASA